MKRFLNNTPAVGTVIAGVLGLAVILHLALLMPAYRHARALRASYAAQRSVIADPRAAAAQLRTLAAQYHRAPQIHTTLSAAVPSTGDSSETLRYLKTLAEAYGLHVESFEAVANTHGAAGTVTIAVELRGSYAALTNFVHDVEEGIRIITIASLSSSQPGVYKVGLNALYASSPHL